ncbi:Cilia- and flagella-associated protein 57, partial [Mortierella sp. 14UC]
TPTMSTNPPKRPHPDSGDGVDPNAALPARKRDRADQQINVLPEGSQSVSLDATVDSLAFTEEDFAQDAISYLENDLLALKVLRLKEYRQPVYIPLMAKANLQAQDDDLFPLMDKVQEFLASDRQVMLILGDSGAGKSTFCKRLESDLLQAYERGGPIPLFINLSFVDQPDHEMVEKQLKFHNFDGNRILGMKANRQFILICDGYDEGQQLVNLHKTNMLNQPGHWNTKMIISCRSQYLDQDYRSRFMPQRSGHYSRPAAELFQEAVIAPFSRDQIENYVDHYVPLESRTWTTQNYMDRLTAIPHLIDLVKNPFLLTLALEMLPIITEGKEDLSAIRLTRVQLYDTFVVHWLDVNKRRLESNVLSADERVILDQLLDAGFISMGIDYSTRLASAIFENQDGNPVVKYTHLSDKKTWRVKFFGPDPEVRLLLESSPVSRTGSLFKFIHRSMLEYFFSRAVFDPSTRADEGEFAPQQDSGSSVTQLLNPNGPLFTRNLLKEPSVLHFLHERVPHSPAFKEQLLAIVEQSKSDPGYSRAAANAMTILVKARVRFNGADLRGIRIPGADLYGGQFDTAQFQKSNLTEVNLTRTWIRQADFAGAVMTNASFGVLPTMTESCSVYCCDISTDGTLLAAGLKDGRISLYDTSTWIKIGTLYGHTRRVTSVAFSPTGPWLVSGSHDSTVRSWDPRTHQLSRILAGHTKEVLDVEFSPNGRRIASASDDKTVRVWDSVSGETELVYKSHDAGVVSISWSPDGCRLASTHGDSVQIWDSVTGTEIVHRQYDEYDTGTLCVEFSPDGQWIVTGSFDDKLHLRDAASGGIRLVMEESCLKFNSAVFSPNGRWIASCNHNLTTLWDTETFTKKMQWDNHTRLVTGVAFSLDGSEIVSCGLDRTIRRVKINTFDIDLDSQDDFCLDSMLEYSADGERILSNNPKRGIFQWNPETGASEQLRVHKEPHWNVAFSPNRNQFAAVCNDTGGFRQWDVVTGIPGSTFDDHKERINCFAYSPCGSWIASGSSENTVRLWSLPEGTPGHVLAGHTGAVWAVAFSPDGLQVASAGFDCTVRLWDTRTGSLTATLTGHSSYVSALSYSPDGATVASGSRDRTMRLWDVQTGSPRAVFNKHVDKVVCIAFSPCGQWLACCHGTAVTFRDVHTPGAKMCYDLVDFLKSVSSFAWNPSRRYHSDHLEFATGCEDGSIRVWRLTVDEEEDEENKVNIGLVWGSHVAEIVCSGANIKEAIDLDEYSQKLLVQRGADGEYSLSDSDESGSESDADTPSEDMWIFEDELETDDAPEEGLDEEMNNELEGLDDL